MKRALLAFLVLGTGCQTLSLGRPPSDNALVNDGSPAEQERLQKRYALAYSEGFVGRPGATPEEVTQEMSFDVDVVRAAAWSDEAADYFANSELANDATDTATVGFDRFAHSGTPVLILQAGGVVVGGTIGITFALADADGTAGGIDQVNSIANAAFNGMFTGLMVTLPLVVVYQWTVPSLSSALAASDYRKGVRAFNKELDLRIRKQARGTRREEPVPPPPTEAPVETPAPIP